MNLTAQPDLITPTDQLPEIAPLQGLDLAITKGSDVLLSQQFPDGYWWYTLEANDSINAEFIFLNRLMSLNDPESEQAIAKTILANQTTDGSWPLYYKGPGDLSTTIECYIALKLCNYDINSEPMIRARKFILSKGGLTHARIFTRIHLALLGLIPWKHCPKMPIAFIHLPHWAPISIYHFSSWARSCVVPLLILLDKQYSIDLPKDFIDELYIEFNRNEADWSYKSKVETLTWQNMFLKIDQALGLIERLRLKPFRYSALKKCERWIRNHIAHTEDIYPFMAYSALALHSLGYKLDDITISKCLKGLHKFRIPSNPGSSLASVPEISERVENSTYQQCCISPVWDTPWAGNALIEAGVHKSSKTSEKALKKAAIWLKSKQIIDYSGDWAKKNKGASPGGWSFEFENLPFPDVDDSIEVLLFFKSLELKEEEFTLSIKKGLDWVLSMQSDNGGWAAFDKNNTLELVNYIPFSDHGACLDPPSPDITGRALELLANYNYNNSLKNIVKAIGYIKDSQEASGAWFGRWGVNYIYGTWCVLQGLRAIGYPLNSPEVKKAVKWLKSVQNSDGGFGESCESYDKNYYVGLTESVPSQTAWGLMGLLAGEESISPEARQAADQLIHSQKSDGTWTEPYYSGTGFPGHFYIRYHGYRHYFPVMALAKFTKCYKSTI